MYNSPCKAMQAIGLNLFDKDSATANVNGHSRSLIIEYEDSSDSGTPLSFVSHNALPRALEIISSFGGYLRLDLSFALQGVTITSRRCC